MPTPVDVQNFDSTTPGTTPTGWVLGASHAVANVSALSSSSPNVLQQTTSTNVDLSYETTKDTNLGKTSWSFAIQPVGTQLGGATQYFICLFRVVSGTTFSTVTCYNLQIAFGGGTNAATVSLSSRTGNVDTAIGSAVTVANNVAQGLQWNAYYNVLINADDPDSSGSLITIQIQRASDGFYLNSSGAFQSGQAYVIAPAQASTNLATLKHNSNVGIVMYKDTGATSLMFDSSDYESLASPSLSITPTGITSAQAFGAATLTLAPILSPTGITSTEAFGTLVLSLAGSPLSIAPAGIGTGEAFGNLVISMAGSPLFILPSGIISAEGVGNPTISVLGPLSIAPTGIISTSIFGTPLISKAGDTESVIVYTGYLLVGTGTNWSGTPFDLLHGAGATIFYQAVIDTTHAVIVIANIGNHNDGPYTLTDGVAFDIVLPQMVSMASTSNLIVINPASGGRG